LQPNPNSPDDRLVIVISISLVVGMAVALVLIFLWRNDPSAMTQDAAYHVALAICPPFFLVRVVSVLADSTLAIVLTAGAIVVANGSLYAGLAALGFWIVSIRRSRGAIQ